ncbi:hypothetical protein BC940DRAFT_306499 [Gongronella butleri]|nr:hypothetical protein BC940DRAFT_306499 [Gongronella butleri]
MCEKERGKYCFCTFLRLLAAALPTRRVQSRCIATFAHNLKGSSSPSYSENGKPRQNTQDFCFCALLCRRVPGDVDGGLCPAL